MKFTYVDESGDKSQGDIFVMGGLLVDAYRLRTCTSEFDEMVAAFLAKHPSAPKELKTKAFINGDGGWRQVDAAERKKCLAQIVDLATKYCTVFAVAFSFSNFERAANADYAQPFGKSYWLGAAMFVAALVQKRMQSVAGKRGLTVLVYDDNKREMSNLADALYEADAWYDPIYQTTRKMGETGWSKVPDDERFDQIVNCPFAIKSQHSSLIQVADAVSYVYRRHLELKNQAEQWEGSQEYYSELVNKLEPRRAKLGNNFGGTCIGFYKAACHDQWAL
jgi:Protein of unknown function (DUF3800)